MEEVGNRKNLFAKDLNGLGSHLNKPIYHDWGFQNNQLELVRINGALKNYFKAAKEGIWFAVFLNSSNVFLLSLLPFNNCTVNNPFFEGKKKNPQVGASSSNSKVR